MTTEPDTLGGETAAHEGPALVHAGTEGPARVDVALRGGRPRWSVGGRIAEGLRWWHGSLSLHDDVAAEVILEVGTELTVVLDNGRTAPAVVERPLSRASVAIRGLGPPPFDVP